MHTGLLIGSILTFPATPALIPVQGPPACTTARINVSTTGAQTEDEWSFEPAISSSGRYSAFVSRDPGLVPGDTNGVFDVFVRDRFGETTERASVGPLNQQSNGASRNPALSANGRWVAFDSFGSNLVPGDIEGQKDVFRYDSASGLATRASVSKSGRGGNNDSQWPSISGDGAVVAFESLATNLIPNDTNGHQDIFVWDSELGVMNRVSVSSDGVEANAASSDANISEDGRWVSFHSPATNLIDGDTNGVSDVFVHDLLVGTTERVSIGAGGVEPNNVCAQADISGDGNRVVFGSVATNLVPGDTNGVRDIFVRDRAAGTTIRVSVESGGGEANSSSNAPVISADGDYVAFYSSASNLVPDDDNGWRDIFVHHIPSGMTTRASVSTSGSQGNADSDGRLDISKRAAAVAFSSQASTLITGDTNQQMDVFVRACGSPAIAYCTAGVSSGGCAVQLNAVGFPSSTNSSGFVIGATGGEGGRDGMFFFGTSGRQSTPWGTGTSFQCVVPPVIRAGLLTSSGIPGSCDGSYSQDLNSLWCASCTKPAKNPGVGVTVQAQLWYRDPLNTGNQTTSLSNALEFEVGP